MKNFSSSPAKPTLSALFSRFGHRAPPSAPTFDPNARIGVPIASWALATTPERLLNR